MPRTGTVFVSELLGLHPDCALPKPIWEDFLLAHASPLFEYAAAVAAHWRSNLNVPSDEAPALLRGMGDGLLAVLGRSIGDRRLMTKTPSVRNVERFFDLFPEARLVIVVRDGRAAAESYVRSFGASYADAMRQWAAGARRVAELTRSDSGRYAIVRYEDLVDDLDRELRRLLAFCGLDASAYDFEAAAKLPLLGSSRFRGASGALDWSPVERPPGFSANAAWSSWSRSRLQEFDLIAGDLLRSFGYDCERAPRHAVRPRIRRAVGDSRWSGRLGRAEHRLRSLRRE